MTNPTDRPFAVDGIIDRPEGSWAGPMFTIKDDPPLTTAHAARWPKPFDNSRLPDVDEVRRAVIAREIDS